MDGDCQRFVDVGIHASDRSEVGCDPCRTCAVPVTEQLHQIAAVRVVDDRQQAPSYRSRSHQSWPTAWAACHSARRYARCSAHESDEADAAGLVSCRCNPAGKPDGPRRKPAIPTPIFPVNRATRFLRSHSPSSGRWSSILSTPASRGEVGILGSRVSLELAARQAAIGVSRFAQCVLRTRGRRPARSICFKGEFQIY